MTDLLTPDQIAIRVHGTPIPQGSKTANRYGHGVRDANSAKLKPWRRHVSAQVTDHCRYLQPLTGPVRVWLRFTFTRPASHYGQGRNAHRLRSTAPLFPGARCGDIDKLTRAILDALTDAGVWGDDTQVVDLRARKFYAGEHEYALPSGEGVDIILEDAS